VVARDGDDTGAGFWDDVCRSHGLIRVGRMQSLPLGGSQPAVHEVEGEIHSTFQVDVKPGDRVNDASLAPLIETLLRLSRPADRTPYVNLHQTDDWHTEQVPDVAGQAAKIDELVSRTGVVVLGGAAPIWAYLAALRVALNVRADVRVFFFDPKQPERLVEIPAGPELPGSPNAFPPDALRVSWCEDATRSVLRFEIITDDKFLPPTAAQNLTGAPVPPPMPSCDVGLSGAGPTWLFGTYARWLISGGARRLASWDGRTKNFVQVWD
jgi:hypothetical protein